MESLDTLQVEIFADRVGSTTENLEVVEGPWSTDAKKKESVWGFGVRMLH